MTLQSRIDAVNNNKGFKGLVKGMLCSLAAAVGCADGGGYVIPPGFGNNEVDAITYIEEIFAENSYFPIEYDVDAQFRNPDTNTYFENEYDVLFEGPSGELIHVEYDSLSNGLTPDAADGIVARDGMFPTLMRVGPFEDETDIADKILAAVNSQ